MKRAAVALVVVLVAGSAVAAAYFYKLGSERSGSERAATSKRSTEAKAKGENTKTAEGKDESATGEPGSRSQGPTGEPSSGGESQIKPIGGELVEPVKRDADFGIYKQLQDKLKFTVLYPGYMPPGATPQGTESTFQMVDQGVNGFALRYQSEKYGAVTVMEGSVFDPMPGKEREQIRIRNGTAYLETVEEGRYAVFFVQNGTRYGLAGDGMSKEEIRKIAAALVPLSEF